MIKFLMKGKGAKGATWALRTPHFLVASFRNGVSYSATFQQTATTVDSCSHDLQSNDPGASKEGHALGMAHKRQKGSN
jgi:hypothetical protein